jgi:hypothetical protein
VDEQNIHVEIWITPLCAREFYNGKGYEKIRPTFSSSVSSANEQDLEATPEVDLV